MDTAIRLVGLALVGSAAALLLRKHTPELGLLLGAALMVCVLALVFAPLGETVAFLRELDDLAGLPPAVTGPVLKAVGISVAARTAAELCRDGGQSGAAYMMELAGAVCALASSLPLFRLLFSLVKERLP